MTIEDRVLNVFHLFMVGDIFIVDVSLVLDTDFREVFCLDELDILELIIDIEDEFDCVINSDLDNIKTLRDLLKDIEDANKKD